MTPDTLLYRQVHPSFMQAGRVTSQAFRPTPKDENALSVYDGDLIGPDQAYQHYTQTLKFVSVGCLAVSVNECRNLELATRPDPSPFLEHAVIDFSGLEKRQIEKKAKQLKAIAETRGWQYQPPRS
jgi:hypothetical protein